MKDLKRNSVEKTKRKEVYKHINTSTYSFDGIISLQQAILKLKKMQSEAKGKGFTDILLRVERIDDYTFSVILDGNRMETEEEARIRITREKVKADADATLEYAQYLRLKEKFQKEGRA